MGKLLSILLRDEPSRDSDVFVDFENTRATEDQQQTWDSVQSVLDESKTILTSIQSYSSAAEEIRQAISNPNDEKAQEKAWKAVCPQVEKLKTYFEFSAQLEHVVPVLLGVLCSNEKTPREHLETQQALFKQFAEILDFVLKFDDLKMTNPSVQNDFSYYRRTLSRSKLANQPTTNSVVSNEMANRMSLFYANATPMLKVLSEATTKFVTTRKDLPIENTTDSLSTMAKICRFMIENPDLSSRIQSDDTKMFCLRVMVGVIILYDHVHPTGAFAKNSGIDIKGSIKVLKDQGIGRVDGLLNALRYTTQHLNDETTPRQVKQLLAE